MHEHPVRAASPEYAELGRVLHAARIAGAAVAAAAMAALGALWQWAEGTAVAFVAAAVLVHGLWRRRRPEKPPFDTLIIDSSAVAFAIAVIDPPAVVVVAPLASIVVTALVMLRGLHAALAITYAVTAMTVATATAHLADIREWSTGDVALLTAVSFAVFIPAPAALLQRSTRAATKADAYRRRLREQDERFQTLVESLPVGVYRSTPDGRLLEANLAVVDLLGFPDRDTLLATPVESLYADPAERDRWRRQIDAHGVAVQHMVRLRRRDGRTIWVRDSGRALLDSTGAIAYYDGTLEDVTDQVRRRALEQAMVECATALLTTGSEEAIRDGLDTLLGAADVDIVFVERNVDDPDLGACSSLLYQANRLGITPDYERWTQVAWSRMPRAHARLSEGEPFAFRVDELDGDARVLYDGTRIRSEIDVPIFVDEAWLGIIGFADTTGTRTWDDSDIGILTAVGQMMGHAWHRDDQRERLEHLVRSRDEFIAAVSHRLRSPLTALVAGSLLFKDGAGLSESDRRDLVEALADQSLEVANTVEDLLVAARSDIGTISLNLHPVAVPDAIAAALRELPAQIRPDVHTEPTEASVLADPLRLRQILRNLFDNAVRYGGGHVEARTREHNGRVIIEVRDDGPGIAAAEEERAISFTENRPSTSPPGPLGIGLAISHRLARMMGGDLAYHRDGDVTVFGVELPKA